MDRLKIILVSLFLLVVAGSVAGVPAMIHLCCNEPVEQACAPEDCCGGEDEAAEDSCCDTQIEVRALDDEASMPTANLPGPTFTLIDVVPLDHGSLRAVQRPACLTAHAAHAPDPPPERSELSIYRI